MSFSASAQPASAIQSDLSSKASCLLCGSANSSKERSLSWRQLRKVWSILGTQLSEKAWPVADESEPVLVWRCHDCGFEFSDPHFAGNGQFYKELQAQNKFYYPTDSQEYFRALEFADKHNIRTVLDVGCGAGAFLNHMKQRGIETHGVDLNPEGVKMARAAGHDVMECLLADLPEGKKFDLVTAWQVVEHVSNPVELVRQCARVMAPGGFFGMAVPFEKTLRRLCPYDPHMWPPHHITRWQLRDLERLGKEAGLKLISSGAEPLPAATGKHFWFLHNQLAPALGLNPHRGGTFLPRVFWYLYRVSRAERFWPIPGASVYAFYSRQ